MEDIISAGMRSLVQYSQEHPRRVHGIDFSGAADAGRKIWIASGAIEENILRIEECRRAETLADSGKNRDKCFSAIRDFIKHEQKSVFGFDFPFGLPRKLVKENNWADFVLHFPEHYESPDGLREKCRKAAFNLELKRVTDKESKTPFSPYNLRVYRQTYYGINCVLRQLVHKRLACMLPMQDASPDKPWILEICPASTLKRMHLYNYPYKGKMPEHRKTRRRILEAVEGTGALSIPTRSIEDEIINDSGGDALDSIVAAYSTYCACRSYFEVEYNEDYQMEGYVFV